MATGYPHHLNAIQQERFEQAGHALNEVDEARQNLIRSGTLPTGLNRHTIAMWEDAEFSYRSWFQADIGQWKYERVTKKTGVKLSLSADTIPALQVRLAEALYDEGLEAQPSAIVYQDWIKRSKWGAMFYEIDCTAARTLLLEELNRISDEITYESLDAAFVALYDEIPSPLDLFFGAIEQPQSQPQFRPVGNPSANLNTGSVVEVNRREQDLKNLELAKTPEGLAILRRRALFGDDRNVGRTLSTGNRIVPRKQ
jgi:hypothetical protein